MVLKGSLASVGPPIGQAPKGAFVIVVALTNGVLRRSATMRPRTEEVSPTVAVRAR